MRVLDILQLVSSQPEGSTLTNIAAALSLPKTSVFSLLKTLEGGNYLRQAQGRYVLGTEAVKLAAGISQAVRFPGSVKPVLERLARDTGETILLGILSEEGHEVTYVDIVESEADLRFTVRTGNRRPLYAAAAGKALLAFLPDASRKQYLRATSFVRFTAETSDRAALAALLPDIRRNAVITDANGIVDGATGIASPCFDETGRVVCAISVAGPTGRVLGRREHLENLTRDAGEEISRVLGFRGGYPTDTPSD